MTVLEKCPFCGSQDVELVSAPSHYVVCHECTAEGPWNDESEQEAAEAWNKRA